MKAPCLYKKANGNHQQTQTTLVLTNSPLIRNERSIYAFDFGGRVVSLCKL